MGGRLLALARTTRRIQRDLRGQLICLWAGHTWRHQPAQQYPGFAIAAGYMCDRCPAAKPSLLLPPGHPESLTALLSEDDELVLAEIDAREWPEDADVMANARDAIEHINPEEAD